MSLGTGEETSGGSGPDLYLTGLYELYVDGVEPGSAAAEEVRVKYTQLARGACKDAVNTFRRWKVEGKVDEWAKAGEE